MANKVRHPQKLFMVTMNLSGLYSEVIELKRDKTTFYDGVCEYWDDDGAWNYEGELPQSKSQIVIHDPHDNSIVIQIVSEDKNRIVDIFDSLSACIRHIKARL